MSGVTRKGFLVLMSGLWLIAVAAWASDVPAESSRPPLNHVPSSNCGECHAEIFQQWQNSMHAKSTALTDPIHGAVYRMEAGDPSQEGVLHKATNAFPVCLQCHAPIAARDKTTKLDAKPMYSEGVNCVACHTMTSFKGVHGEGGKLQLGAAAYEYSANHLQGPEGAFNGKQPVPAPGGGKEPKVNSFPHQANAALYKSSDVCLGCHQVMMNPQKVPVCQIGDQLLSKEGPKAVPVPTCQSCHMPVVNGFSNHEIAGGHNAERVRKSVVLALVAKPQGGKVHATVTLRNTLLHTMPSSAPFRNVVLKVTARNAKGEVVWSNFKEAPDKEDPQALMILKLVNNEGQPVMPPQATKVGGDTRLKPGEKRVLDYSIPAGDVKTVRAELFYNLITRPMMEKMGDKLPEELKTPALIGRADVNL
ncbi:MAG: cytochrome c family protein [Magnetococcales bacterium]|nr:cytochrome c family protein [Magnetococcales bacterium]